MGRGRGGGTTRTQGPAWIVALFGVLVFGVLLSASPLVRNVPWRDSGIFLYVGQTILAGGVPYRDTWDHKPPLIYFINALGLWLGHGSWWGVWGLELVSLSLAVMLSFRMFRRAWGLFPALFASLAWLVSLGLVLDGGNLTEEYALPCQFAILHLFMRSELQQRYGWRGPTIGVLVAAAFFLRQNLVGVGCAVVVSVVAMRTASRCWRRLATELVGISSGFLAGVVVLVAYLASTGALADFWDQTFRFNLDVICGADVQQLQLSRLKTLAEGVRILAPSGVVLLAVAAWLVGMWRRVAPAGAAESPQPLWTVFLIGLPLEFFLTSLSGRWFAHYYMAWLPMCAVGAGAFARVLTAGRQGSVTQTWLIAWLVAMSVLPLSRVLRHVAAGRQPTAASQAIEFLRTSTSAQQYVLVLGNDPAVNFMSRRRAPTRFFGQFPLYTAGYTTPAHIQEFLSDLKAKPPVFILDTYAALPDGPSLDPAVRQPWWARNQAGLLPEFEEVFRYTATHYAYVGKVAEWSVYRYHAL